MKKLFIKSLAVGVIGCALAVQQVAAISIDIVNVEGANLADAAVLNFRGDSTFTFDDATTGSDAGKDFRVNGITGGLGDSYNLRGNISGIFTIGAVVAGSPEYALVSSSSGSTLSIFDGTTTFSGAIDWIKLTRDGTSGDLNISGSVNLTGITYTGAVQDLIDLMGGANQASAVISFSFNPAKTISELKSENVKTSYSGDITSVPEGGLTLALLGIALVGVDGLRRRLKA